MLGNHVPAEGEPIKAEQRFDLGGGPGWLIVVMQQGDTSPIQHAFIFIHCFYVYVSFGGLKLSREENQTMTSPPPLSSRDDTFRSVTQNSNRSRGSKTNGP